MPPKNQSSKDLVYGCITHIPLTIDFPDYVKPICLGESQADGQLNLRDLAPEWIEHHPILGGTAGTFALKNYVLRHHPNAKQIGICQYRKFVTRDAIGIQASNYKTMNVISCDEFEESNPNELMWPGDAKFVVGKPAAFNAELPDCDYLVQYLNCHHIEDLLRFTAEAIAVDALKPSDGHHFLREVIFFPGGVELGIFPADFWLSTITDIENTVRACIQRYGDIKREGYQSRAWAFCVERLGSYLLLKHFRQHYSNEQIFREFVGQLHLINNDGSQEYTPGT